MVRKYKRNTDRSKINEETMRLAIQEVLEHRLSIRKSAKIYDIKAATLQHRVEKLKRNDKQETRLYASKYCSQQVFSQNEEKLLNEYILTCSKMHYGLTLRQVRELAYQYATKLGRKYPKSWDQNKSAGVDWAFLFRQRNTNLSLKKPENTSANSSFGFSRTAVNEFFENLENLLKHYKFTPDRIINIDETGITTVLSSPGDLIDKKQKQVGQLVSAEQGKLITFCVGISGTGNTLPPAFIFPRVYYQDYFISGAPEGSLGLATRSGLMNAELWLQFLKHLQRHTTSSISNPVLIICDNHESHISIEAINYARENGIVYLSLPPNTSHKLQPLDVGVFGPFKAKLKVAFNDWHANNPGKGLKMYDIPKLARTAFLESFTGKNITSGFSKTGIWPLNKLTFGDTDFLPCQVYIQINNQEDLISDRDTTEMTRTSLIDNCGEDIQINQADKNISMSVVQIESPTSTTAKQLLFITKKNVTLDNVRPSQKPDKEKAKEGKARRKSRLYTDTREKDQLADLCNIKKQNLIEEERRKKVKEMKCAFLLLLGLKASFCVRKHRQKQKVTKISKFGDSSSESDQDNFETMDTSDESRLYFPEESKFLDDAQLQLIEKEKPHPIVPEDKKKSSTSVIQIEIPRQKQKVKKRSKFADSSSESDQDNFETMDTSDESRLCFSEESNFLDDAHSQLIQKGKPDPIVPGDILKNDFLLIKFQKKKSVAYFVGQVITLYDYSEYQISFLRKKPTSWIFVFPIVKDLAAVPIEDVILKLPQPKISTGTSRTASMFKFDIDLNNYNVL